VFSPALLLTFLFLIKANKEIRIKTLNTHTECVCRHCMKVEKQDSRHVTLGCTPQRGEEKKERRSTELRERVSLCGLLLSPSPFSLFFLSVACVFQQSDSSTKPRSGATHAKHNTHPSSETRVKRRPSETRAKKKYHTRQ
jgi:hypothetical protein